MPDRIAAVIPALDAADTLPDVLRAAMREIEPVVVIDDGSSDRTGAVAADAGATVLTHSRNLGKGAALKTGFRWALERDYAAVVTLDADGQHLPSEIPKFIARWNSGRPDLLIGDRSHLFGGMLRRRRLANQFSAWSISTVSGATVHDSQSGFRLYSARLLREIDLRANGFDAESEVIVRAARRGMTIEMLPIELGFVNGISTSHYRPILDTLRIAARVTVTRLSPR